MSISQAIATHLPKIAKAQTEYQNSVALVSNAMLNVTSLTLPTLNYPPSNWDQFVTTFTNAKTNANQWASDVLVQLYSVPQEVDQYNQNITTTLKTCAQYAQSLTQGPNPVALEALTTDLPILSNQLNVVSQYITACQNAVKSFNDNLPTLLTQLQTLSTDFTNQQQVDQQKVQQLQTDISNLNNDINQQISNMVAAGVLVGAMVYFGKISGWTPTGVLVKILAVGVMAAATYGIDLAADTIAADKAAIQNDTKEITGYTADAQNCAVIVQSLSNLVNQMSAVSSAVASILAQWNAMMTDITAAVKTRAKPSPTPTRRTTRRRSPTSRMRRPPGPAWTPWRSPSCCHRASRTATIRWA